MRDYRDSAILRMLVLEKLEQERGATRTSSGIKAGERSALHPELRQREDAADLNSGKGPAVNAPAKFTGLHLVSDNSRNWRTQLQRVAPPGVRQFLVLVR